MENRITIAGKEYRLGLGLETLVLYEQASGSTFEDCKGVLRLSQMLYCVLTANNKGTFTMGYEEFLGACEGLVEVTQFARWMESEWKRQEALMKEGKEETVEEGEEEEAVVTEKKKRVRSKSGTH
jgi:hypothetical protein